MKGVIPMKLKSLFEEKKTVFSLEIFPPKKTSSIQTIYDTLDALSGLSPDFISVTYGAGGNPADRSTVQIASTIKHKYNIEPLAHLTCVNSTHEHIGLILDDLRQNGIENILALRGDINPNIPPQTDYRYACDLIRELNTCGEFDLAAACYPEGHPECPNMEDDILHLKQKVDAGATHLISQLFFDNNDFYNFLYRVREAGIMVPIEAGIMPVTNRKQIERMVSLCGASLPKKFVKIMHRYGDDPAAMQDAGIAYAVEQIVDLISNGVQGIHLYTMNNPLIAHRISQSVASLIRCSNH